MSKPMKFFAYAAVYFAVLMLIAGWAFVAIWLHTVNPAWNLPYIGATIALLLSAMVISAE